MDAFEWESARTDISTCIVKNKNHCYNERNNRR
jgi:hypothetical protein